MRSIFLQRNPIFYILERFSFNTKVIYHYMTLLERQIIGIRSFCHFPFITRRRPTSSKKLPFYAFAASSPRNQRFVGEKQKVHRWETKAISVRNGGFTYPQKCIFLAKTYKISRSSCIFLHLFMQFVFWFNHVEVFFFDGNLKNRTWSSFQLILSRTSQV